ncbi:hypothetical protein IW140_002466 [Coemansia sp. RSA 1813]|nr:hypothetical protein EV178_001961 [Coemansia sp. RSA 1646]KAJ2215965.1 hypothetical protein EV179_001793 [Coemansia sp. RSA 487]KAJ2570190.1 hypothetical protein IW140_002466 [Coemansia sp. RSA 1813]
MSRASRASTARASERMSVASSSAGARDMDNQATEELTGFQWDEGTGAMQEFAGTDALSEIGGVVSQVEANMDFTTNLDTAMEGVQKRQLPPEKPRGAYANFDDISMSRFADSYWKVSDDAAGEVSDLGLEAMEFSTQTAETTNGNQVRADGPSSSSHLELPGNRGSAVLDGSAENDDSFLARATDALRVGSRASSRHTAQQRPGSQHSAVSYRETAAQPTYAPRSVATTPGVSDADNEEDDEEEENQRLPTFSSPRQNATAVRPPPALNMMPSMMSIDLTRPPLLAADSASTVNDGAENRYARLVARYSGAPLQQRLHPTATGRIMADHLADDLSSEALSLDALPDTPGMNATAGFSSDQMSPGSSPGMKDRAGERVINNAPRQPVGFSPRRDHLHREPSKFGAKSSSYYDAADNDSFESLEHPNMGSQGSPPPPQLPQTVRSMGSLMDHGYYDNEQRDAFDLGVLSEDDTDEFGDGRINSFGGTGTLPRIDDAFRSIADADDMFGDRRTSSDPDMSSIIRDHERVFNDLFDSDGPTEDLDGMQPPDSLFASSTSIAAELSRRRQQRQRQQQQQHQQQQQPQQQNSQRVSTWDGREATADALLLQEAQFSSVHRNPIEMLEKTNSLGMATEDDSDVSGLLPESAISPASVGRPMHHQHQTGAQDDDSVAAARAPPSRIRSNTGMQPFTGLLRQRRQREQMQIATGLVGGMPTTPQSAPPGGPFAAHEAPPPTTPTTFIMRDTRHRPASRVLRQVSPLNDEFSDGPSNPPPPQRANGLGLLRLPRSMAKRPAGPRAPPVDYSQKQRVPSNNTDATSSVGLGSLLHDSSMVPAELTRTSFATTMATTPRNLPFSRKINGDSPMSAASNNTTAHYVPFQEPTVDVSRLPDYRDIGVGHIAMGSGGKKPGASPLFAQANVHSSLSPSVGSDTVPTTATNEPAQNGPSLRDIYDLLQRTVSTIEPQQEQQPVGEYDAIDEKRTSFGDLMVPRQLQSSFVDTRPSAPTPRRSRRIPWYTSDADESDDNNRPVDGRPRGNTGQSRVRAYLHRYASEPIGFGSGEYAHEPARDTMANTSAAAAAAAAAAIPPTTAATVIPSPLAEKLVELAAMLAKNGLPKSPTTRSASQRELHNSEDGKKNELLRREILHLHRQILTRIDGYHADVDMLRAEVRHASTAPSTAAHRMSSVLVAPHDSVSAENSNRGGSNGLNSHGHDADDVFSSESPSASQRPLMQMPPTARNKQRHMVQWLSSQHQGNSAAGEPRRTTVEDIDDEAAYEPSRACVYGGSDNSQNAIDEEYASDAALSDASTTVPDPADRRMSMRNPIGPYIGGVPSVTPPPKRAEHRDLLEMRELLHSVRRRSIHRHGKKYGGARDDGEEGKMLYSKQMAQQLADTLAELQHVHVRHFHSHGEPQKQRPRSRHAPCAVCAALDAQNHDPYLYGRNAVAYRSMTTRQLQGLLNAYVAAMEDEFGSSSWDDAFDEPVVRLDPAKPVRHVFTPSRSSKLKPAQHKDSPSSEHSTTTRVVIGLLREELDALSRRYHRLVDEFHALDPSNGGHQRRRRTMTRELKDLVDMLDVKGEQIAMLSALHPADALISGKARGGDKLEAAAKGYRGGAMDEADALNGASNKATGVSAARLSAERAYRSARALQQALGELY